MGTYRKEWECCGSVTETQAWEPDECPFCSNEAHNASTAKVSELQDRVKELEETLQYVERWANHHGQKSCMTPAEALSCIQHYPPILEITRSYADGKVPDTPNPWERVKELEADAARYRMIRDADTKLKHADLWDQGESEFDVSLKQRDDLDRAIDAALSTQENTNG